MKNREEGYFYMSEDQIVEYLKENLEENANICVGKRFGLVPYVNVKTEGLKGCFRLHLINNGVLYVEIIDETGNSIQSKFFNDDKFFYEKSIEKRHKMILDLFSTYYKKIREYLDEFLRLQEDISQGYSNSGTFSVNTFFNNNVDPFYSINVFVTNPGEEYPEKIGITRTGNKIFLESTIDSKKVDIISINPPAVNYILRIYWDMLDKTLVI